MLEGLPANKWDKHKKANLKEEEKSSRFTSS
jgi:hypothetical protein